MAGHWPSSFFFLRVYGPAKKKKTEANIQPSLPRAWSIKDLLYAFEEIFSLDTAGSPEWEG